MRSHMPSKLFFCPNKNAYFILFIAQREARDLSILFLVGVSTRSLSMISERLIGRRISPTEISSVSGELNAAVEAWRQRDLSKEPVKYLLIS